MTALAHLDHQALEQRRLELEAQLSDVRVEQYRRMVRQQVQLQRERDAWLRTQPPERPTP